MIWTRDFWKGAGERAIKTFAQTLAALVAVDGLGVHEVEWLGALSVATMAAVASVLTSIGNADFTAGTPQIDETSLEVIPGDGKHRA